MSTGIGGFSGFLPNGLGQHTYSNNNTKGHSRKLCLEEYLEYYKAEPTLSEKLAEAVKEYKEKVLKGLDAMTEDDFNNRVADFIAKMKPDPEYATDEMMRVFYDLLAEYKKMLRDLQEQEYVERLLITAEEAAAKEGNNSMVGLIKQRIQNNLRQADAGENSPDAQADMQPISSQVIQKMVGRYENMVPLQ